MFSVSTSVPLCQFSFHQMLRTDLSPGAGVVGRLLSGVPRGFVVIHPHENKKENCGKFFCPDRKFAKFASLSAVHHSATSALAPCLGCCAHSPP
jgi:hypothetical protein